MYKQIQTQVYPPPPLHNNYRSIAFDRQKLTAGVLLPPPVEIAIESVSERNRQLVMSVVKTLINYYHFIYLTMQLCCSKLPLQPAIKNHKGIIFCTVLNNVQLIDSFFQNFLKNLLCFRLYYCIQFFKFFYFYLLINTNIQFT